MPDGMLRRALAALLLAPAAPAQVQNVVRFPDGNPAAGPQNTFPFGKQGIRYQQIVPGSLLRPGSLVQDLFVASFGSMLSTSTSGEIVYGDIEIRLGTTPLAAVVPSWSANNPNPTVVHRGRLRQRWQRDAWVPLGLDRPFAWVPAYPGDNLCLEVIVWDVQSTGNLPNVPGFFAVRTGATPRAFHPDWTTNPSAPPRVTATDGIKVGLLLDDGNFVGRGHGCPGGNGARPALVPRGWPRLGATFTVDVSGLAGNALALPILGFDEVGSASWAYPFGLGIVGAPACMLWHEPLVILAPVAGGGTAAAVPLPIPGSAALSGLRARMSAVVLDPGAPGGLAATDYGLLIVGT